jgi:HSP20 family protein
MNQLIRRDPLDDFFRGFLVRPVDVGGGDAPEMKIDVKEEEKQYRIHAEIPGVNREDIHVHIEGAVVSISAERSQEKEVKEGERVLRTERYFGKVSRSFQLAQEVDEAQSAAKYTDGVLELSLPKKLAAQAKRLVIQ